MPNNIYLCTILWVMSFSCQCQSYFLQLSGICKSCFDLIKIIYYQNLNILTVQHPSQLLKNPVREFSFCILPNTVHTAVHYTVCKRVLKSL